MHIAYTRSGTTCTNAVGYDQKFQKGEIFGTEIFSSYTLTTKKQVLINQFTNNIINQFNLF